MKIINKIFLTFLFLILSITKSYSVSNTAEATTYKITMTLLELCDSTSTATSCNNPVVIGSGTSADIDIADTAAGAAAAAYGNLNKAAIGTKYTYMQVTLKRAMTVAGSVSDDTNTCYTSGDDSSLSTAVKGATSGPAAEVTLYAALTTSAMGDSMNSVNAADGSGTSQAAGTVDNDDEYFEYRMALSPALILKGGRIPTAKVAFGTSKALGYVGGDGLCTTNGGETQGLYAAEPDVTVTFE